MTQRIGENRVKDSAITSDKIANNAITSDKIANNAITSNKLAPGSALPPQTGNATYYLTTDGSEAIWKAQTELAIDSSAISNGNSSISVLDTGSGLIRINVNGNTVSTISNTEINHNVEENALIRKNSSNITSNITMANNYNYMSAGPITIDDNVVVVIEEFSAWSIV